MSGHEDNTREFPARETEGGKQFNPHWVAIAVACVSVLVASYTAYLATLTFRETRRALEMSNRAYIYPDKINLTLTSDGNLDAHIVVRNYGATPAVRFRHQAYVTVLPFPLPDGFRPIRLLGPYPESVVPPTSEKHKAGNLFIDSKSQGRRSLTAEEIAAITTGTSGLYLFGLIEYADSFGISRKTEYCAFKTGPLTGMNDARTVDCLGDGRYWGD